MSKKGNNKRVKQMIADLVMQGRKVYWYGEETEKFLAPSEQAIRDEFNDASDDYECELISADWRYMWRGCICERDTREPYKGEKVYDKKGQIIPHFELLPLLTGYKGTSDEVIQLSSGCW